MAKVAVEKEGPITVVAIDRFAEARNAVDPETAVLLREAFLAFDADASQSVAILTGRGGTFCAGYDLKVAARPRSADVPLFDAKAPGPMGPTRHLLSKPVIAAVEGYAVAGGLELALWCDLRVAATDAVFGVYCRRWGVPLIDGGTIRLPRLIGHSNALDLILTGRGVSGEEAQRMGIANRLVAPGSARAAAVALAHELAALPQRCMRSDRRSSYEQWDLDFGDALAKETELGLAVIASGETVAGARRFAAGAGRHGAPAP
jgi:enoyl-CoA hydratase